MFTILFFPSYISQNCDELFCLYFVRIVPKGQLFSLRFSTFVISETVLQKAIQMCVPVRNPHVLISNRRYIFFQVISSICSVPSMYWRSVNTVLLGKLSLTFLLCFSPLFFFFFFF